MGRLADPLAVGHRDGHGQGVGGVVGGRDGGQPEDRGNHPPDLLLVRRAIAGDRDLDLVWRRLAQIDPMLGGGQQDHPAGLPHGKRGLDVLAEEQALDAHQGRAVSLDQLGDGVMDDPQSLAEDEIG